MSALAKKYGVTDQQLGTMVTDQHIADVSLFLVRWEDVAHQLGVSRINLTAIRQEPGITAQTKNQRVLEKWKAANFRSATYKVLVETLDKLSEAQCADQVCGLICGGATGGGAQNTASPVQHQTQGSQALALEKPTLRAIRNLEEKGVYVIQSIGTNYSDFGIFLLDDPNGAKVDEIKENNRGICTKINEEIIKLWLKGGEKGSPVTWDTLLSALGKAKLCTLEEDLKAAISQ